MLRNIFLLFSLFIIIHSCTKCTSSQEVFNNATPADISDMDKKIIAFSKITKMTYLLNDTSIVILNLEGKSTTYVGNGNLNDRCANYQYKTEYDIYIYKSKSPLVFGGIQMEINAGVPPAQHANFTLNVFDTYLENTTSRGAEFNLNRYTKIDSIKTSFDSIYYDLYIFPTSSISDYRHVDTSYYSASKGIVKVKDFNNNVYELIKTE